MSESVKVPDGAMSKIRAMFSNLQVFIDGVKSSLDVPPGYTLDYNSGKFTTPMVKKESLANAEAGQDSDSGSSS